MHVIGFYGDAVFILVHFLLRCLTEVTYLNEGQVGVDVVFWFTLFFALLGWDRLYMPNVW